MRNLFSDRMVTIKSATGQKTVLLKSGMFLMMFTVGAAVLTWTTIATGLAMWHLTGLANLDRSIVESRTADLDSLRDEMRRLAERAELLRRQNETAFDLYMEAASSKSEADALLAEIGMVPDGDATASDPSEQQTAVLMATLDRSMEELDKTRKLHAVKTAELEDLRRTVALENERRDRAAERLAEATESLALASDGLEGIFRRLGLAPVALARDARRLFSGMGGADATSSIDPESTDLIESAIPGLNMGRLNSELDRLNLNRLAYLSIPVAHPVVGQNRFTSGFGTRTHPVTGKRHHHQGADFAARTGTAVVAAGAGQVISVGFEPGYGRTIRLRHIGGIETLYGHLSKIRVDRGQVVARGDRIGDIGSTGQSTGPHLHYEIRVGGKAVDPLKFIGAN